MKWLTADQHFYHENIIRYCSRPFKDVDEMNEIIVENFNYKVGKNDETYHIGDFAWKNGEDIIWRLNGKHHLLIGNHDYKKIRSGHYEDWFDSIQEVAIVRQGHREIFCSHYAHRVWPNKHRGAPHAFGHSHGNLPPFGRSMDAGVDSWGFFPASFDEFWEVAMKLDFKEEV